MGCPVMCIILQLASWTPTQSWTRQCAGGWSPLALFTVVEDCERRFPVSLFTTFRKASVWSTAEVQERQVSLFQDKLSVNLLGRGLCRCRGSPTAQPPSWDCSRLNSPWTIVHNLMNFAVNCFSKQIYICDILES